MIVLWLLGVVALLVGLYRWLGRAERPDTIDRFKQWRP